MSVQPDLLKGGCMYMYSNILNLIYDCLNDTYTLHTSFVNFSSPHAVLHSPVPIIWYGPVHTWLMKLMVVYNSPYL